MEILIASPSYRRPFSCDIVKYIPSVQVFVDEKELFLYQSSYPRGNFIAVPAGIQGNNCRVKNYILDRFQNNVVCIVDDDLTNIGYHENGHINYLSRERDVQHFLYKYTVMALDLGVHMWGVNLNQDYQLYHEWTPFALSSHIAGPFSVHVNSDLRYDERLSLKDDYDMVLQQLNKYRKILRLNKFFYLARQAASGDIKAGGCSVYRTLDEEERQNVLLQKKWGSKIVQRDTLASSRSHSLKKVRTVDINPIVKPPIKGL